MTNVDWFHQDSKIEVLALEYISRGETLDIDVHKDKHTLYAKDFLNDIHQILIQRHGRYKDIYLHNHDYYELEYVLKGQISTTIDGHSHTLEEGSLLLLNPNCYHDFKSARNEDTLVNVIIEKTLLEGFLGFFKSDTPIFDFLNNSLYLEHTKVNYIYFKQPQNDQLRLLIENFINCFKDLQNLDSNIIKLNLCNILLAASTYTPEDTEKFKYDYDSELVINTYDYINSNLDSASLNIIASKLGTTNYTLSRIFKKKTGKTFMQELQKTRFNKAYDLVKNTSIPINDIAHQIGYDNLTFFYKKFKEIYGNTPNDLRTLHNKQKRTNFRIS